MGCPVIKAGCPDIESPGSWVSRYKIITTLSLDICTDFCPDFEAVVIQRYPVSKSPFSWLWNPEIRKPGHYCIKFRCVLLGSKSWHPYVCGDGKGPFDREYSAITNRSRAEFKNDLTQIFNFFRNFETKYLIMHWINYCFNNVNRFELTIWCKKLLFYNFIWQILRDRYKVSQCITQLEIVKLK